jgi:integrase/recombinase XerD
VKRLIYDFLDYSKRRGFKVTTLADYELILTIFFNFIDENYPDVKEITEITRDMVLSYEKYLTVRKDGKGKLMARNRRGRYVSCVKTFFTYLEMEEKVYRNPAGTVSIPKHLKKVIKDVLTVEEMNSLLKACPGTDIKSMRDRAMLELLYSTGIRADEMCNILIEDVDFNENVLFVRKGKLGNQRVIPFGGSAGYWVKKYLEKARDLIKGAGNNYLFVSMNGNRCKPDTVLRVVKYWAGCAGIDKRVHTHTFRHSCATHLLKGSADIRYVQKQLGHRDISTTEKYLKIEITDLKEVHERCHPREQDDW